MTTVISVFDLVGKPMGVSIADAQKVFEKITQSFQAGQKVELSFTNVEVLITAFFNAAIGQLYNGDYSESFIDKHLAVSGLDANGKAMLERSIDNTKRYYANPEAYDRAWKEVVDEGEE